MIQPYNFGLASSLFVHMLTLNGVRKNIFYALLVGVSMAFLWSFVVTIVGIILRVPSPAVQKRVSRLWFKQPIIAVYIPTSYYGNHCAQDYESIFINNTITSVSSGPCGCPENTMHRSTNMSCLSNSTSVCTSLARLPAIDTKLWRGSTICIKRGGEAAVTVRENAGLFKADHFHRPQPDKQGNCPGEYRKCGYETAICFPIHAECPITNLMILPGNQTPPAHEKWEMVGTFAENNHTLYTRRQYEYEQPIVDLVVHLVEQNDMGVNRRGVCYQGSKQVVFGPLVANPSRLWSYNISLPPACEMTDSRYTLIDTLSLRENFLQHLQRTEPACVGFDLYPLSDPRYQPARDPDYLNSGVKCDFTSEYTCVRHPYHRTDCATNDDICDGVVNQNICGAYTHAVRSAFQTNTNVSLGIYYAREMQWNAHCSVTNDVVLALLTLLKLHVVACPIVPMPWLVFVIRISADKDGIHYMFDYFWCAVMLLLVGVDAYLIGQIMAVYNAVQPGDCTDAFTREVLLNELGFVKYIHTALKVILTVVSLLGVESAIQAALTLRHSKLVWRSYTDQAGRLDWHYVLEPLVGGARPAIQGEQSMVAVSSVRKVRKSVRLGY